MLITTRIALACAGLTLAMGAHATCFQVFDSKGDLVYRSTESPVDMSRPLHETLPEIVPGGRMIFSMDLAACDLRVNRLEGSTALAEEDASKAVILAMPLR